MARGVVWSLGNAAGFDKDLIDARTDLKARSESIHKQTALNVQRRARASAPDDPATAQDLKAAITVAGKGSSWRVGLDDRRYHERGGGLLHQQPHLYGIWYEYGFKTLHIQTTPYMRPAADREEEPHVKAMESVINDSLGKA